MPHLPGAFATRAAVAAELRDEIHFPCQVGAVPQQAQIETIRNIGERVIRTFEAEERAAPAPRAGA